MNNIGALCSFLRNKKNIIVLNYLNVNTPSFAIDMDLSEKLWYFANEIKEAQLCLCGEFRSYIGLKNGYRVTCGRKDCFVQKRKETSIKNWGVDNPKKHKDVIEKTKKSILETYDGKHYMFDDKIRNKFNETMMNRYGVKWAQENAEIKSKSANTWNNNINKEEIINNRNLLLINKSEDEKKMIETKKLNTKIKNYGLIENCNKIMKEKSEQTCLEKYGKPHHFCNGEIQAKRIKSYETTIINKIKNKLPYHIVFNSKKYNKNETDCYLNLTCKKCNSNFDINRQLFIFRQFSDIEICLICNPIISGKSKAELNLLEFIRSNYAGEIIENSTHIIHPFELDIFLPELKIAFEYNGLYWHSDIYKENDYHLNKSKKCEKLGIELFHIWEDDWIFKENQIKLLILNKLGKLKIFYGDKCQIKIVDGCEYEFIFKNSLKEYIKSDINIVMYYGDLLVSIICFNILNDNSYELKYFVNINAKLFKYFMTNYNPKYVIYYFDYSMFFDKILFELGFRLDSTYDLIPEYYYIIKGRRISGGEGLDYLKIFDCGKQKFILNNI